MLIINIRKGDCVLRATTDAAVCGLSWHFGFVVTRAVVGDVYFCKVIAIANEIKLLVICAESGVKNYWQYNLKSFKE